jgi:hypothetical protein
MASNSVVPDLERRILGQGSVPFHRDLSPGETLAFGADTDPAGSHSARYAIAALATANNTSQGITGTSSNIRVKHPKQEVDCGRVYTGPRAEM